MTGGTGFVGSHLIKHLLKKDYKIYSLQRSENRIEGVYRSITVPSFGKANIENALKGYFFDQLISYNEKRELNLKYRFR